METTAILIGSVSIHYSGLLLFFAALSGGCLFFGLQKTANKDLRSSAMLLTLGLLMSLPLSRLLHWYSNTSQYASLGSALIRLNNGGFVALGVFAAFLMNAVLLKLAGLLSELPTVLDNMACAGAMAAAVGKLACFFSPVCRSKFTLEGAFFRRLPFMVSSTLSNGTTEWRIATFCLQSIAYFIICALAFRSIQKKKRAGDTFALTLSLIGAVQVVLDSTRYDAAYFRSNGFVSITQVFCVAALLTVLVVFSVRSVKVYGGVKRRHILLWLLWAVCAGVGGYCEYYVQRHAGLFLPTYAVMASCFLGCFAVNWVMSKENER